MKMKKQSIILKSSRNISRKYSKYLNLCKSSVSQKLFERSKELFSIIQQNPIIQNPGMVRSMPLEQENYNAALSNLKEHWK